MTIIKYRPTKQLNTVVSNERHYFFNPVVARRAVKSKCDFFPIDMTGFHNGANVFADPGHDPLDTVDREDPTLDTTGLNEVDFIAVGSDCDRLVMAPDLNIELFHRGFL
jgi:hypothetical protein